jgi:hypothetical protein
MSQGRGGGDDFEDGVSRFGTELEELSESDHRELARGSLAFTESWFANDSLGFTDSWFSEGEYGDD